VVTQALDGTGGDEVGLRVNGSHVASAVWEWYPAPAQPPECVPKTRDGLGRWRCTVTYTGGATDAPMVPKDAPEPPRAMTPTDRVQEFQVEVAQDGSLSSRSRSGEPLSACCVPVR
jgi:hypothetical protein